MERTTTSLNRALATSALRRHCGISPSISPRQASPRRTRFASASNSTDKTVRLLVKDAGVGIDSASLARLFEPFYTTKPTGMGIGLSVCRSIIERHGGRLYPEPHGDGPGVTFVVSIPFDVGVESAEM